uniref:Tyrosine-protein phosphatase domain-containing protein n=1 Tax=Heterorhabditis bacteriophora TaxID=37862 RepID=A0A1I7XDF0_HETBA
MKTLPNTTKKHSRSEANEIYPVRDDALKEETKETRDDITRNEKSDGGRIITFRQVASRNDKLTKWHKYVEEVVEAGTEGIQAILTQLPMQHTAAAFWRMILDNDVQAILLILTHFEYQTFCASAVFPGQQNSDFIVLPNVLNNSNFFRFVHVHHYSGWVHGKEPHEILELWQIQSTFR